jgi:hypothetical protein
MKKQRAGGSEAANAAAALMSTSMSGEGGATGAEWTAVRESTSMTLADGALADAMWMSTFVATVLAHPPAELAAKTSCAATGSACAAKSEQRLMQQQVLQQKAAASGSRLQLAGRFHLERSSTRGGGRRNQAASCSSS